MTSVSKPSRWPVELVWKCWTALLPAQPKSGLCSACRRMANMERKSLSLATPVQPVFVLFHPCVERSLAFDGCNFLMGALILPERHFPSAGTLSPHAFDLSLRLMSKGSCKLWRRKFTRDAKELRCWGSHSLRVGACVGLHAVGFSPLDVQWMLQWRSLAFMACPRNIAVLP